MFRRITSNNKDKPPIWQELYNRWEDHIGRIQRSFFYIINSYPKTIYSLMVSSILISLGCFFYLPKSQKDKTQVPAKNLLSGFYSGMGSIAYSASATKELFELQSIVEQLVRKDSLTQQDSAMVLYVFERMQKIENSIINSKMPDTLTHK